MQSTPLSRALSALYMWKLQDTRRRVTIELSATASEGLEPAAKVTLAGVGISTEGTGSTLVEAARDALEKHEEAR